MERFTSTNEEFARVSRPQGKVASSEDNKSKLGLTQPSTEQEKPSSSAEVLSSCGAVVAKAAHPKPKPKTKAKTKASGLQQVLSFARKNPATEQGPQVNA